MNRNARVGTFFDSNDALSPADASRQDLTPVTAIHWYQRGVLSQERAAELAGLNRRDFIRALAREGVDVFALDVHELARELSG